MISMLNQPDPAWAWLGATLTTVFFLTFVGWIVWAFAPSNRAQLEAAGRMPLDEEESR